MKLIVSCMALALSLSTMANSIQTQTFTYDGSQDSTELVLKGEKTRTEYRIEDVLSTCYRNEIVGYTTVCTSGGGYHGPHYPHPRPHPYPGHHPYPGQYHPHPGQVRQCYSQPIYRSVGYSCMRTVRTPFKVKEYDVDARVIIDVTNLSEVSTPGERFNVTLIDDSLSFEAVGSKKFFIVRKYQDIRSVMNGSVKMIDAVLAVELVESAPILKPITMTNITMKGSVLNFDIGEVSARDYIDFSLKIAARKILGSDTVLLDRKLLESEAQLHSTDAGSMVSVDVEKLGVELSRGRYSITATAAVKVDGPLMNSSQFRNELEASRTLNLRIR